MCKRKKYSDIVWLFLASPDKVKKEKDEFRDKISQVLICIHKKRLLSIFMKKTFSSATIRLKLPKPQLKRISQI